MRAFFAPMKVALALCALIAVLIVAPAAPARAEPAPPHELLVQVAVGPAAALRSLAAYAEAVQPGTGMVISEPFVRTGLARAAGATSLDGFDPASWTYLLVASVDGTPGLAVASKVRDAKQLAASAGAAKVASKGGWAVVGPEPVLDRIGAWALAALPAQRAPATMNATVYVPNVLASYKAQIEGARAQMLAILAGPALGTMAPMMTSYFDGVMSVVADTDRAMVTLEATADLASLDLALVPRAGSRLAKFVALQRPSNYALIERLPDTPAGFLLGGHLELGPYHAGMLEMASSVYGPEVTKEVLAAMDAITRVMTGELAMAARFSPGAGLNLLELFAVSDTAAADRAFAAIFALFKDGKTIESMGLATMVKTNPGTVAHDGVAMRSYETSYDLSKVPEAERKAMAALVPKDPTGAHVAAFDHLGLIVFAPHSRPETERAIDAARGKAPRFTAPQVVGQLLASSRARKDSLAAMLDIGAIMSNMAAAAGTPVRVQPGPFVLSFGCADRNAHFRIAAPAASARSAVNASKP